MAMRGMQSSTSLPFPVLITELCLHAGVSHDKTRHFKVTPISSCDIRHLAAAYTREEACRKRAAPDYSGNDLEDGASSPLADIEDTSEVTTLKAEVANLRKDVDYLKSIDFTSLLEVANDMDAPATSEIPSATIGDIHRDDIAVDELKAVTDKEHIEVREKSIYGGLLDLEETIVQLVIQTSLRKMSMATPSGSGTIDVTLGIDAHDQTAVTPGTDAPTD
ncbi:hypothetical protein H5410_056348 [Solanum commersonii]|uniref:Polyprotein protein n=1 Tax=Solanum commersonii TaxID=4109 RepID=A0A9J5WMU9_SOLCO|nr:hypothetical protein H5410_056348 [Solanum commersonii]